MKRLLILLCVVALLLIIMVAAPYYIGEKGYVLISIGSVAIEMTVVSLLISLVVGALGLWVVVSVVIRLLHMLQDSTKWFGALGERKRKRAFFNALQALAEHNPKAAKLALAQAHGGDFQGVDYLLSAQLAWQDGENDKAGFFADQAEQFQNCKVAIAIQRGQQALQQQQPQQCLGILAELDEKQQQHPTVAAMQLQALAQTQQWQAISARLPKVKALLSKADYAYWSSQIAKGKFAEIASKEGALALQQHWQTLPRKQKADEGNQHAFVELLLQQGFHNEAAEHLIEWQKKRARSDLIPFVTQLKLVNPSKVMAQLEQWIKADEHNASLYSALAHVAFNAGDIGLADKAIRKALTLREDNADKLLLVEICQQQNKDQQALVLLKEIKTGS